MQRRLLRLALLTVVGFTVGGAGAAQALAPPGGFGGFFTPRPITVLVRDDCDPATFNAALQDPEACVRQGGTTFGSFVAQLLSKRSADGWDFVPDELTVASGRPLAAWNVGGEFHTFTKVAAFGGGCIQEVNDLLGGLTPVPECRPEIAPGVPLAFVTTGVAPGDTLVTPPVTADPTLFMCLIHPWMKAVVHLRNTR
jgi:hypothetical protein